MKVQIALVLSLAAAGCGNKRLAECEAFQKTVDKLATCKSLPAEAKTAVQGSSKQLKELFDSLDAAGGMNSAPDDVKKELRETCRQQNDAIVEVYSKVAPDCLK